MSCSGRGTGNAGNGTSGAFGYDTLGRPSSATWTGPGSTLITSDTVTRDEAGRVTSGQDFTYDNAGRLTDAWVPSTKYDYDFVQSSSCTGPNAYKNTNRTSMTVTPNGVSPTTTNYCYDHADRLASSTDTSIGTIAYDTHGNSTTIFGETHTYDAANRHLGTTKPATTVSYVRDALDRIVERKVNGTTSARYGYTQAIDTPTFITDNSNSVQEVILSLPGGAIVIQRASGALWSYPNLHGDVAARASSVGSKLDSTSLYDPYGNVLSGGIPDNAAGAFDLGWVGSFWKPLEHDSSLTPIIEMGARQYAPVLGRFLEAVAEVSPARMVVVMW